MTAASLRDLVQQQLGINSLGLHEGITTGFSNARTMWKSLDDREYRWLLSMNARARMREHWQQHLPALGWTVGGNASLMGQTILVSPDKSITLRLLKEHPHVHPGGVPYAGPTRARQDTWTQDPLPGIGSAVGPEVLAKTTECLLLWNCNWNEDVPALAARVVHTLGPGRYGSRVPIDLSYKIDPSGTMYDQLKFAGAAEIEDLFPTIYQKDNEEDAAGQ